MLIKNICVLGGGGFVGKHLVALLSTQGYKARVPTRNRERAKELLVLPEVEVTQANLFDAAELRCQLEGMDAVINLVGILHEQKGGGTFRHVHVELPRLVAQTCAALGIRRLLHMSALPADPNGPSAYLRTKGEGEAAVREAASRYGLHATIFRPSVIFGREDTFLNLFARLAEYLPLFPLASPNAKFQPVFVGDVAHAYAASLANPATFGNTYELCGPKIYTLKELVEFAARTAGHPRPIIPLGNRLSYLQALLLEFLPGKKLMTRDNYHSMQVDNVCRCPFPEIFGTHPAALEAVAPEYLAGDTAHARYQQFRNRAGR